MLNNRISEKYFFWENKSKADIEEWFLMSSPIPILAIWIMYLAFVLRIGPQFMRKRSPFDLKNALVLYNILQVIVSCFVFHIAFDLLLENGLLFQRQCITDSEDLKIKTARVIHYYILAKVSELLDTIFFVLRKKDRQVTFLHVYHHSFTMLCSWSALKYEPSYSTIFLGAINSFVHIIMYAYYGLSAFPHVAKYLWWKKYITKIQLVQFFLIVVQMIISHKVSSCRTSITLLTAIVLNTSLFMYLFADFYVKEYLKKKHITKDTIGKASSLGVTDINKANGMNETLNSNLKYIAGRENKCINRNV